MDLIKPNVFREDTSRNLHRIFPPAMGRSRFELPQILNGSVQLIHDYLSTLPYVATSIVDVIGANGVTSIIMANGIPDATIMLVDSLGLFTDDAVSREYTVFLHYVNAVGDFSVPILNVTNGAVANRWTASPLGRFVMPPLSKLEVTVPAITAGTHLRFTMAGPQVPAGQFVPRT